MINLILLMPKFQDKLKEFIIEAQYQGFDVDVESGYRSIADQNKLYQQGRTTSGQIVTKARGGYSWHNWGVAADVVFRKNGLWDWNAIPQQYASLSMVAKAFDLEWGGDFRSIKDLDHFQLTGGLTIEEANQLKTIPNVWKEIARRING